MQNKLWTRDFTIITLGTVVSMLGNAVSGFAIGLIVLDFTKSTFLFAFFMVMNTIPRIIMPLFAGPYIDRFSRKKVIYVLDFISSALYFLIFISIITNTLNYAILLVCSITVGMIDAVYGIAYESLYPNLISEGNYSKAYSISSMLYPLAAFMTPVASIVYKTFGTAAPLFLFNSITFLIAACFETQIKYDETHVKLRENTKFDFKQYIHDFKQSLKYISAEKGLLTITMYFVITTFASGAANTVMLPFFKNNPNLFSHIAIDSVTLFTIVSGFGVIGRLIGGAIHYKFKYPVDKKFTIALFVYATIAILEATQLYLPIPLMSISFFLIGILGVTSFNIRISATQSYLPDQMRGRFNGVFQMLCSTGGIVGQLLAGGLGEFMPERIIIAIFMSLNLVGVFLVMYRGKNNVKKIYNRVV